jgi:hypothetical protein
VSLPGADELFRTTGGTALQSSSPASARRPASGEAATRVPAQTGEPGAQPAKPEPAGESAAPASGEPEHSGRGVGQSQDGAGERRPPAAGAAGAAERRGPRQPQPESAQPAARRRGRAAARRPSGRERHDEKITVYVSAEELMDLEHARLVLRGEHGLAVDRGRIVREAVAVVLADLESRGDASILVRRLRGR